MPLFGDCKTVAPTLSQDIPNWCLVTESAKVTQGLALFMCTLTDGAGHCNASSKAPKATTHKSPKPATTVAMGVPQVLQNVLVILAPEPPEYS